MSGVLYCYYYDGNGLRVAKLQEASSCANLSDTGVFYWRDVAGNTIAETGPGGITTNGNYHEYVFFAGRRVARSDVSSATVYYYFVDHLGSTRIMAQANGTVCFSADYYPYGQELNLTATCNPSNTAYKFTGYERDAETGLDYAFARYYNSRLGRFMSGDPIGGDSGDPQSLNRYAYAGNNPVNFTDPLGLYASTGPFSSSNPTWPATCLGFSGSSPGNLFDASLSFSETEFGLMGFSTNSGFGCSQWGRNWLDFHTTPLHTGSGGGGGGGGQGQGPTTPTAPSTPSVPTPTPSQPQQPQTTGTSNRTSNGVGSCLWEAAKDKGASIVLDALGAVPALGNATSAAAGVVRAGIAINHAITSPAFALGSGAYGAYQGISATGPEAAVDSFVGTASGGTSVGLTLADVSLGGTKAIPLAGNLVSVLTFGWDAYQAVKQYQACRPN